jgi:hypothetical protein
MSLKSNLFNGKIPAIFNPKNFIVTNLLDDIVSNNIVSQQVQAPIIQRVAENGDTDDFITESELDTELNSLKSLLLGSDALNNSLNSIVEINNAINNDPNFYTTITTNIATKANQSALNTTNSNVDALDTRLDTAESTISSHTSTLSSHTSTLSSHTTSINDLNSKTNAMSYNSGTNTLTMNEKVIVNLDEFLNGNVTIGNASTDALIVNSGATFNSTVSGLTKATVGLGNCDNTSDANKPVSTAQQTALNAKANLASPTFTGTVAGISKSMVGLGNVDNTTDANKPVSTAQQTALNLKANQTSLDTTNTNVTNLQNKTNAMTYNSGTNTLTMNESVIVNVDESLNGNVTIGNASTDTLVVNSATTFNGSVSGLTKTTVGLGNLDNTSDANKPVSTAQQTALNLKANLASPTFTGTVIVPTVSQADNSTKVASTAYVDTAVSNLINSAPSALNTLNELATALGNDANYSTTITTALATKGALSGNNTWSGDNEFTGDITFDSQDLASRLSTDETNIANNTSAITTLNAKTSAISYDAPSNTTTINSKMVVTKDVSEIGSIYLGDSSGGDIIYVRGNINSNLQTITPAQLGYVSGASSNLQTQISAKANLASPTFTGTVSGISKSMVGLGNVDNTSDTNKPVSTTQQTALDLKANLASPTFTGTVSGITKAMISLGNVDNTSDASKPVSTAQQTALDLKANLASPTFTGTVTGITKSMVGLGNVDNTSDSGKPVSTAQQTALDLKANLASPTFTGTVSSVTASTGDDSTKIATTAFVKAQSYLTTSSASSTYAGLSSNNTLSGTNNVNMINENINYVSGVTTSLSLDYSTCKGINLIATPSANYSFAITNVPTGSTNAVYTVTLLSTAKYYVNSITVNGTSRTIYATGGTSNISINASASYVMQQLSVSFLNSSTPVVFSSVLSIW